LALDVVANLLEVAGRTIGQLNPEDRQRSRNRVITSADADVTRQGLYKALSENGDPRLSTLLRVINSLGVRLSIQRSG